MKKKRTNESVIFIFLWFLLFLFIESSCSDDDSTLYYKAQILSIEGSAGKAKIVSSAADEYSLYLQKGAIFLFSLTNDTKKRNISKGDMIVFQVKRMIPYDDIEINHYVFIEIQLINVYE